MTKFEKLMDNVFTFIGIFLMIGLVGFSIGFLIGAL